MSVSPVIRSPGEKQAPRPRFVSNLRTPLCLLDLDPELGDGLSPERLQAARRAVIARGVAVPRGRWSAGGSDWTLSGGLGLLVIEGLLVRRMTVAGRTAAELVGDGDLIGRSTEVATETTVPSRATWQTARPTRLAVLDRAFVERVAPWPEILAALSARTMARVQWLSIQLALRSVRRIEDRLLLALWELADRWGRVTPTGVEIQMRLTHSLLAEILGTHRPTVTLASRALADASLIEHRPGSRWLLLGPGPAERVGRSGDRPLRGVCGN